MAYHYIRMATRAISTHMSTKEALLIRVKAIHHPMASITIMLNLLLAVLTLLLLVSTVLYLVGCGMVSLYTAFMAIMAHSQLISMSVMDMLTRLIHSITITFKPTILIHISSTALRAASTPLSVDRPQHALQRLHNTITLLIVPP